MAIIRPGPLAGAISGRLGGVVFVNGRRSASVRPYSPPTYKSSKFLNSGKSYMGRVVAQWQSFTDEEKAAWSVAAAQVKNTNRIGTTKAMSGFTYFVHHNFVSIPDHDAVATTPPPTAFINPPVSSSVSFSASGDYDVDAIKPTGITVPIYHIFGWPYWRTTTPGDIPRWRFLKAVATAGVLSENVRPEWEEHFGPLQENQYFSLRLKVRSNVNPASFVVDFLDTVAA